MFRVSAWLVVGVLLLVPALSAAAEATPRADAKTTSQFLRIARDKNRAPLAMETAIRRFGAVDGTGRPPTVDLVAAVHIAERSYYEQLNRLFADYDAVLYELVAPEKSRVPLPGDSTGSHPISLLQNGMKDVLELEYQLKAIDYTRKNMVHADMSPEQFAESMQRRGESMLTMFARMMGYAMTQPSDSSEGAGGGSLLLALFDKNRAVALKRVLAEQFENSEGASAVLDGPNGSTLIRGRNQVAAEVLRREIAAGNRKLAIFYGAAHMPDFETRLRDGFKLVPLNTRWLAAWNLQTSDSGTTKASHDRTKASHEKGESVSKKTGLCETEKPESARQP
jgi:hypothetical protein